MDKDLRQTVEERSYDSLIATPHDVDVFTATLRKTSAVQSLKAGAVLALSESDNKYVILGSAAGDNEVLAEDVETSTTADINVTAYRQGHFNRNVLTVSDGYTISKRDIEKLRDAGIYLEAEV